MKISFKMFCFALLALLVTSCSETRLLQKGLAPFREPLGYEFTSPIEKALKRDTVAVLFHGFPLESATTVKRVRALFLPFIVFYYSDFRYRVKLGASSMSQDYNDFFFNALLDESDRSGTYALRFDSIRPDSAYTLEVTLDSCETTGVYKKNSCSVYVFDEFSTTSGESLYPTKCRLSCMAVLRKGERILSVKKIAAGKELGFPADTFNSSEEMYLMLTRQLVETLCQCTRDCVASIVAETSRQLENQQ